MSDKPNKLKDKIEQDSEAYRLNKLLEILLQADLKCLDEMCVKMSKEKSAKN